MNLIDMIKSSLSYSSKADKKLAEYILSNKDIIYKTISEVIDESDVGYGTVIRYCKKLGCSGFQDFKIKLASESSVNNKDQKVNNAIEEMPHLIKTYSDQIQDSARVLEMDKMEKVANIIISAKKILVIGVAGSYSTAIEVTYRLTRFGFNVICESDEHMQAIRASALSKDDALIVISFSGSTKSILDTTEIAKSNKAKIIAITNYLKSPLAEKADICLLTALWEEALEAEITSRIPFILIVEILTTIIKSKYSKAVDMIKKTSYGVSGKQI